MMTGRKPQTSVGTFALITLLLAGVAVGRVLGVSFGDALYLTGLVLVVLGWVGNRVALRCANSSNQESEV